MFSTQRRISPPPGVVIARRVGKTRIQSRIPDAPGHFPLYLSENDFFRKLLFVFLFSSSNHAISWSQGFGTGRITQSNNNRRKKGLSLNTLFRTIFEFNNYSNSTLFSRIFRNGKSASFPLGLRTWTASSAAAGMGEWVTYFLSGALLRPFSFLPPVPPARLRLSSLVHGGNGEKLLCSVDPMIHFA